MLSFFIHPDILNPERCEIVNIEYKGLNLYQYLQELGIDSDGLKPIFKRNEKEVECDYVVYDDDVIHIYFELEAPVLVAIAGAAAASAGVGAALASSALIAGIIDAMVAMVATFAAQALMRALGLMPSTSESESSSPTYGWDDFTNSISEGNPIPILYGKHKVAGQVINQTIDIDGNKEYLNVLMALTDHQINTITDVRVNDQPYTYYNGVSYQTRLGTLNQSVISGFGELSYQQNIDVRLNQNVSNIRQTDGDQVEKIELVFSAPNGLFRADDKGDYHSVGIDIDIYYRVLGAPMWKKYKTHRIEGKSKEAIRNTCVIDNLSPDQYEVKILRTTTDSSDFKKVDIVYFTSIREVVKEELSYPGVSLLAVKALASDQLSGSTPSFTCIIERATVSVYNPYTELWVERSAYNPAWQCYDLLVNVHNINKDYIIYDEFVEWANYCDEYIDEANTKRFEASVYIDNQGSIWSNVQRLSNLGRAVILRKGLYYGVFVDKADDVITNIFNMSNIVEGSFYVKYFNIEDRANAYEISYTDPDRDYSNQIAAVYGDEYKNSDTLDNKTNSQVYAAIPRQQAFRECAFSLNQNRLQKKVIAFKALSDSFNCTVGDLIYFCHEVPDTDNVISGRILSAGNDGGYGYVTIEKEFDYDDENTYNILIRDSQDRITESVVTDYDDEMKTLTLSTVFTNVPDSDSVYVLGKANIVRKKYRLVRCQSENNGFSTLEALEYLDALYTDDDFVIEEDELDIPVSQDATAVKINERLVYGAAGDYQSVLDVNWNSTTNLNYSNWTIYLQKITDSYEFGDEFDGFESSGISNEIINVGDSVYNKYTIPTNLVEINEVYRVYICPKGKGCYDTGYNTAVIQTLGKFNNPGNVTYFNCEWDAATRTVSASWTLVSDIDVVGYEIRKGLDWETGTFVILAGNQNQISFLIPSGTSETVTYWIKAVDSSGIFSQTAKDDTIDVDTTQTTIEIPTGLELSTYSTIENSGQSKTYINCFWESNAELSQYFHAYSILVEDVESGRVIQHITVNNEYTVEVDANKLYTVKVQAIDVYGNRSNYCQAKAIYSSVDFLSPDTPVWSQLVEGFKTIFLKWNAGPETDIAYYQVQRASNSEFTSGVVNTGNKSGTFTTINDLDVAATYYFRIRAVDGSGNSSAWSTVISGTTLQIGSADVAYNSIGANHIYVDELSAISANCGTLTSGVIQSLNWSENAGVQIDLDNEVFKIGGSENPALEWDGNEITIRNSNEGQELTLSGTSITVGDITDGDYCIINSGDIEFYRYIAGEHRQTKSLKRVEYGTATNGVITTLPGHWKTQPKIIVSPLGCSFYAAAYSLQDQFLSCQVTNVEETTNGSGIYRFLPKIQLVLAEGVGLIEVNDTLTSSGYTPTETTPDNVTAVIFNGTYSLSASVFSGVMVGSSISVSIYAVINGSEYFIKSDSVARFYSNAGESTYGTSTKNGTFSYEKTGLTSGEHELKIRAVYTVSTPSGTSASGSVTFTNYQVDLDTATVLATGTLNYIAIGE